MMHVFRARTGLSHISLPLCPGDIDAASDAACNTSVEPEQG